MHSSLFVKIRETKRKERYVTMNGNEKEANAIPSVRRGSDDYKASSFWRSLVAYTGSFHNSHQAAVQICMDLGIKRTTARDWILGKRPRLESYILLGWYLCKKGYLIPEFKKLPHELHDLAEILQEKRCSLEDVLQAMSVGERQLFMVFCGVGELYEHKLAKLQKFLLTHSSAGEQSDSVLVPVISAQARPEKNISVPRLLATVLKSAQPLVDHLSSDNCMEEERRLFREKRRDYYRHCETKS